MRFAKAIFLAILVSAGCSEKRELFTVRIAVNDSVMTYSDGRVIESVPDLLASSSYTIPSLADTLDRIRYAIADSERHANVMYPSRLIVDMRAEFSSRFLLMIYLTAMRYQCGETRFIRNLQDGRQIELPIIAAQGYGIRHFIEIRPDGVGLSTQQDIIYPAPPYESFDEGRIAYSLEDPVELQEEVVTKPKKPMSKAERAEQAKQAAANRARAAASRRRRVWSRPPTHLLIRKTNDRHDLTGLRDELKWMTGEFKKLGVTEGRHFSIFASESTPSSEFFDVAQAVIESFPIDEKIQRAALWDVAPPPIPRVGDGTFRYYTGWSARFDEFSLSFGGLRSYDSVSAPDDRWRQKLLCLGGVLYRAVEDSSVELLDQVLRYDVDVNGYVFDGMEGGSEEQHTGAEGAEDWHGYTPLLLAVSMNRPGIARYLISKGADVNKASRIYTFRGAGLLKLVPGQVSRDYHGGRVISPLMLAREKGREEIIKILKGAGAK
jgi:hypothetical protein